MEISGPSTRRAYEGFFPFFSHLMWRVVPLFLRSLVQIERGAEGLLNLIKCVMKILIVIIKTKFHLGT
jgi:hypothetical protein